MVVFFSSLVDTEALQAIPGALQDVLGTSGTVLGSAADAGIFGTGHEVQGAPAISVLAAKLPEIEVATFFTDVPSLPEIVGHSWGDLTSLSEEHSPHLLVMGAGSFNSEPVLKFLDLALPFATKVGGIIPGRLFYVGGEWRANGVGGAMLKGPVCLDAIVSQGCAPLGNKMLVTACSESNQGIVQITSLNGMGVMQALQSESGLTQADFRSNLLAGLAVDPSCVAQGALASAGGSIVLGGGRQEYVVRHIVGLDQEAGALLLSAGSDMVREGETLLKFHAFGADAARDELVMQLESYHTQLREIEGDAGATAPAGGLMVSCAGRGQTRGIWTQRRVRARRASAR